MTAIKALIFDCDGTLISSQQAILVGIQQLMSEYRGMPVAMEEVHQKYSPDMGVIAERFGLNLADPANLQWASKRWAEILQNHHNDYAVFDGLLELLEKLQEEGLELYVWTARDRRSTREILTRLNLMSFFLDMRCFDDTTPKPDPAGLEQLVPHLLDRKQVAVIGDSTTDIMGAKSFGAYALAAFWDVHVNKAAMKAAGPDAILERPADLLSWLENKK